MAYPRFRRARTHKFVRRTSGAINLNSTTWANVDTGLDLTLEAQVGDVIEYGISAITENQAVYLFMDAGTLVSGSIVTALSSGAAENNTTEGAGGWYCETARWKEISGSVMLTLGASDISGGTVTVRLRYRTATATLRVLRADSVNSPLLVWMKNLGPVDPN